MKTDSDSRVGNYQKKLRQTEKEALHNLHTHPANGRVGFCHVLWAERKRILKER